MIANELVARWLDTREKTYRLLEAIPESAMPFRAGHAVRSIGEIATHLFATQHTLLAGLVTGNFDWKTSTAEFESMSPSALSNAGRALDQQLRDLASRPQAWFGGIPVHTSTPESGSSASALTRTEWLQSLFEHELHHRGQLAMAMRLAGIEVPKIYE